MKFIKHQSEIHNISPESNKIKITNVETTQVSQKNSDADPLISALEHTSVENLEIKEEIIEDQQSSSNLILKPEYESQTRRRKPTEGPYICFRCMDNFELRACFLKHQRECTVPSSKTRRIKIVKQFSAIDNKIIQNPEKKISRKYISIPPKLSIEKSPSPPPVKKIYECNKCGRCYEKQQSYSRHLRECGQESRFQCNQCGAKFKRKYHMKRHSSTHHSKFVKPFLLETQQT